MSEAPPDYARPSDPSRDAPQACACGGAGGRAAQRLEMLRELAGIGMRLARGVERQAKEADAGEGRPAGDLGLVFARIARAVRQTLALEARLEGELEARAREAAAIRERRLAEAARAPVERRARLVRRAVARAIEADAEEGEVEQLFDDLDERLADREDDDDFLDRPVSELVARICKDLGVTPDWSLWEDEGWAIEEAAARRQASSGEAPGPDTTHDPPPSTHLRPGGAPSWLSG
jgi:hypothetical protein